MKIFHVKGYVEHITVYRYYCYVVASAGVYGDSDYVLFTDRVFLPSCGVIASLSDYGLAQTTDYLQS